MQRSAMLVPNLTIGLDLGDKVSPTCEVDAGGNVVSRSSVATSPIKIDLYFGARERCRVVLEVGTHSPWISRRIEALGHEVVVSNPGAVYGKRRRKKRNDDMDAEFLARQGRADPRSCIQFVTVEPRHRRIWRFFAREINWCERGRSWSTTSADRARP